MSSNTDVWLSGGQLSHLSIVRSGASTDAFPVRLLTSCRDRHAVVVFVRNETGDWLIGDPALGQTTWINEELQSRFTGEARYSQAPQEIRIVGQVASPQQFAPSACRLIEHCHWEVRPVPALRNLFDIPD